MTLLAVRQMPRFNMRKPHLEELEKRLVLSGGTVDVLLLPVRLLKVRRRFPRLERAWGPMSRWPELFLRRLPRLGSHGTTRSKPHALIIPRSRVLRRSILVRPATTSQGMGAKPIRGRAWPSA